MGKGFAHWCQLNFETRSSLLVSRSHALHGNAVGEALPHYLQNLEAAAGRLGIPSQRLGTRISKKHPVLPK